MISRRLLASGVGAALLAGAAATSTAAAAKAAAPPPRAAPLHLFAPGARPASSGFRRARPASVSIQPLRVTPRPLGSATSLRATSASPAPRQPSSISATPSAPTLITSFAGTSEDDAIGRFHTDQVLAPPDTNISVGTSDVIDVNNSSLYFYTRAGAFEAAFDINAFTGLPCHADSVTDPRVVFDSASGRFYFSVSVYVQSTGSGCVVLLASPASNVTTGTWVGYALQNADTTNCSPCFFDQPRLGYSDSIVAVAANEFVGNTANSPGGEIWIVQKSDLIAGSSNPNSQTVFADGPFSAQPVQTFGSSGGNQYVIWNDSYNGTGRVGVRDFTGQPESGNVSAGSAQYAAMQLTSGAVMPAAQSGTAAELNTDDDRLLDGVWQNGTIWTEGGTNCTTSTVANACINLLSIAANTSGTVASPANQLVYGISGDALYYPSIGVDSSGNAIAVWDQSSASADESIMVAGLSCGSGTCSLGAASTLHASSTYYDPGPGICSPGSPAVCRWGDYSGAAQDPAHPSDIWVAAEDSDSTTANCSSNECWSTYIGRYTYSKPSISSISPPTGPPTLSRTVTVNGSDFLPGTTATFGGNPVTVSGLTPDSFQFTVPTHSGPGALHTQASGTNGTSSLTTSDRYIYGVGFSNDARGDLAAVNSNSEWLKTASGNSFVGPSPWQNNTPFYGDVAALAGELDADFAGQTVRRKRFYLGKRWLVFVPGDVYVVRASDLIWAYHESIRHRLNGIIPLWTTHQLSVWEKSGRGVAMEMKKGEVDGALQSVAEA
ncbi:MAG: IPT/TIG domain-containing protein, partial [Candidatus Dormibacteraeota bacterium]|nr:IPT/TIG domain-containing protein [Candidatus Dormibacteraeota bacterium]